MNTSVWLAGSLATHRRSRILQNAVGTTPLENKSVSSGLCMLFGTDFQEADTEIQQDWYNWSQSPGRTLLLIPPFATGHCAVPCKWEILRRSGARMQQGLPLVVALATEVRYELRGQLQVATHIGGSWDDLSICTAYYRKHPHSGVFAITCLPLWSLAVLDREQELQAWLDDLHSLAGMPIDSEAIEPTLFEPKPAHFTVMLHLLSERFADETAALEALQNSPIFKIDIDRAHSSLTELQSQGLVEKVQLTERGQNVIRHSSYAIYAAELEAL